MDYVHNYVLAQVFLLELFQYRIEWCLCGFYILTWGLHSVHDRHIIKYFMLELRNSYIVGEYYH